MKILTTIFAATFIFLFAFAVSAQTTAFNYQGRLTDTGAPSANYDFEFRLFSVVSGGTALATQQKLAVPVTNNVFNVTLDFGASVFDGSNRWLEIAVKRPADATFTTLSPRQQINSVPYSVKTKTADLATNSNQLGGVNASEYVTNASVGSSFIKNGTTQQTADFNVSGTGSLGRLAIGLNIPSPPFLLDVNGSGRFAPGGSGGGIQFGTPAFETGMTIVGTNRADLRFDGSTFKMVAGAGSGPPSSLNGLQINTIGNIGAGTAPDNNFRFDSFGPIRTYSTASTHFVAQTTGGTNTWARFYMRSPSRSWFIGTSQNFNGNQLYFSDETANQTRMVIDINGNIGIGTTNPSLVSGFSGRILDVTGSVSPGLAVTNIGTGGNQYFIYSGANGVANTGHFKIYDATHSVDRFTIANNGFVGIGTNNPTQQLDVAGTTKTSILQITGGSDLAENFEIGGENIKPGMVVAIDPNNPGRLVLASGAYNRQVAGVISGANNLSAGMVLPDLKEGENSLPLALSGRVWVYVDATKNPVKPGDLLTTSDTPGFAMKVTKHKRANGAIIGKAMTELKSGTGLVLVLVSLQ